MRIRPLHLSLALIALCAVALAWVEWRRSALDTAPAAMADRLAVPRSTQMYVDVRALRTAGLLETLAGSKAAQESDYRDFVEQTKFDYTRDLDSIHAAFRGERKWFLLRGRFDWEVIRRYAEKSGAKCVNGFCHEETRKAGMFVSFFALAPNVMALAVSDDPWAAMPLREPKKGEAGFTPPEAPAWISFPSVALEAPGELPDGVKALVGAVREADRVTIGLGSVGDGFQAELTATCAGPEKAAAVKTNLDNLTDLLRKFLARANQTPSAADLSGVLSGGSFQVRGAAVLGVWPVQRVFLDKLAEGRL